MGGRKTGFARSSGPFFSELYAEPVRTQPSSLPAAFTPISEADRANLTAPITYKEIQEALYSTGDYIASGPNGFPVKVYKSFWNVQVGLVSPHLLMFCGRLNSFSIKSHSYLFGPEVRQCLRLTSVSLAFTILFIRSVAKLLVARI